MSAPGIIEAVLFDMDGVLASVGDSYRQSIVQTAARFGIAISHEDITLEKKRGNSNNDWILTKRLIEAKLGETVSLEDVTTAFEEIYQGTPGKPGLRETELLIPSRGFLEEIKRRCGGKIGVVTGRPVFDCETFLNRFQLKDLFAVCICMEDAPAKPDPTGVIMACEKLKVDRSKCMIIGDTPDDIKAGKAAGLYAYGVLTPEEDARITLGLMDASQGMTGSLVAAGADGVMRVGMSQMLDIVLRPEDRIKVP